MSVEEEIAAISDRLAAIASEPFSDRSDVAVELGQLRARLRELAESNDEVGQRLGESLGLRRPPRPFS